MPVIFEMKQTYIFSILLIISGCKSKLEDESAFPAVTSVSTLKTTEFVPTLESSFSTDNNIVYCATFPYAWAEIKKEIGTPLSQFTNKELENLNENIGLLKVLNKDEYETSVEIHGNEITAKAMFRKSLPFESPLTKFQESLEFGTSRVESFGFLGKCGFARINYFNNESDFSISLFPANQDHEIILIMNQSIQADSSSFTEYFNILFHQKNQNTYFNDDDKVQIPLIEFNLENNFEQFIGSNFRSLNTEFEISGAYQRNAFILNEKGAEVESKVEIAYVEEILEITEKPKMMIFNKPFLVFLKRKNAEQPYFGVFIANDELLLKE